jgi:hypothetical protein
MRRSARAERRDNQHVSLVGTWRKVASTDCDRRYPEEIEFREATFLARKAREQGFVIWDAGGYQVVDPRTVKIDIATDEQVRYRSRSPTTS